MNLSIIRLARLVYEICGILDGHFIRRQYIGYTKKQALDLFRTAAEEGEFDYGKREDFGED